MVDCRVIGCGRQREARFAVCYTCSQLVPGGIKHAYWNAYRSRDEERLARATERVVRAAQLRFDGRKDYINLTIHEIVGRILRENDAGDDQLGRVSFESTIEGISQTIGRKGYLRVEIYREVKPMN